MITVRVLASASNKTKFVNSLCVAEVSGILSQHLEYLRKTKGRSNPSRSELVEPTKQAQGKKGGCHKNPWRPPRALLAEEKNVQSKRPCHPYSEIHHNNKTLIVCFLDDQTKAVECRQCRMEFPRRQKIVPYDIVLSHEEKWMYPDPTKPNRKLQSAKYAVKFYCVKRSCIKERFPYYDSSLMQIPIDVQGRLRESHQNLLAEELFGE